MRGCAPGTQRIVNEPSDKHRYQNSIADGSKRNQTRNTAGSRHRQRRQQGNQVIAAVGRLREVHSRHRSCEEPEEDVLRWLKDNTNHSQQGNHRLSANHRDDGTEFLRVAMQHTAPVGPLIVASLVTPK